MRKLYLFLGILFTITLFWILVVASATRQDTVAIRLSQMDRCIKDLQIPCRWVPDLGGGYGYPLFNYLPPLPYYFGEIINLISANLNFATKLMFAISSLGSFAFMYLLTRKFWGDLGGILCGIIYFFLPYKAFDIYTREAIGAMWALMFFPVIFLTLLRLKAKKNVVNMLIFSLSISGLILSHHLSAIIFLPLILILVGFMYILKKQRKFLIFSVLSLFIALGLSSFYLLPIIFEKNLVHIDTKRFLLPTFATEPPTEITRERYQILTGDSNVFDFRQGTNWLSFKTITKTHTIIRLSQYYFPNWKIFIDKKEAEVEYKDNSLGLMTIILGKGEHTVWGKLFDTPVRIISNVITLITILLVLILSLYQIKGAKKWVAYYKKGVW